MSSQNNLPPHSSNDSEILEQYKSDYVYTGSPEHVHRVRDWQDTAEVLEHCHNHKIPVTFAGSQTSMTGSSVADSGLVIALGNQGKILDIDENFVVTEPGVILGDLKRKVLEEGCFFPPDPTSYNEAQVGASVATNATGSETYKFGPTRLYVQELEILTADGKFKTITRQGEPNPLPIKNHAGYNIEGEEIDELIGSEGTLALITKLKLNLLKDENPGRFDLTLPFGDFSNCLDAVLKIANSDFKPRALELIGPGAGKFFSECGSCPQELKNSEIFLYLKDDYKDDADFQKKVEAWFDFLTKLYSEIGEAEKIENIFLAQTPRQIEDLRECRHHIPVRVNEEFFPYTEVGGGKVGTDWWVPEKHLKDMMLWTYQKTQEAGFDFLVFGHIGNGHPHWNFLTKSKEEYQKAFSFVQDQCRKVVGYGGGIAGEHGIGKIKKKLLNIQIGPEVLKKFHALKNKWDPNWILGQGNIIDPTT